MSDLIAFLRAINVGGRQAKNTDLRAVFERMGYTDVDTFIASGNVLFSTASPRRPRSNGRSRARSRRSSVSR